jgi:hypothetical protein
LGAPACPPSTLGSDSNHQTGVDIGDLADERGERY